MKIKLIFIVILLPFLVIGQKSRNGIVYPLEGVIRCLVVYYSYSDLNGAPTTIPADANDLFNTEMPSDESNLKGLTKYFYEASLHKVVMLGDYVNQVILLDSNCVHPDSVITRLHRLNGVNSDLITAHNYSVNNMDFDLWTYTTLGTKRNPVSDSVLDILLVIDISKKNHTGDGQSYVRKNIRLKKMKSIATATCSSSGISTLRHELAHNFMGSNEFHNGGANRGFRMVMGGMGGYGLISGGNAYNLPSVSAWDRWRLGWFNSTMPSSIVIGAQAVGGGYKDANITSVDGTQEFVLRDFIKYGDAVRIKLPYLGDTAITKANEQWIWLENHQMLEGSLEKSFRDGKLPKGIRANIQIGNNNLDTFADAKTIKNHYYNPLCPFGNFDFSYSPDFNTNVYINGSISFARDVVTNDNLSNPLCGFNYLMTTPYDTNNDNVIGRQETAYILRMFYNGVKYDNTNFFNYGWWVNDNIFNYWGGAMCGSSRDAFKVGEQLSISTNPPALPQMTWSATNVETVTSYYQNSNSEDNRKIYLNGLKIEFVSETPNPDGDGNDIRVRVSWNNYDITNDLRWCGDIELREQMIIKAGKTVTLDQGLSPTKPVNPIDFKGQKVFADPTVLTLKSGSSMTIEDGARLVIKNGSKLLLENGSNIYVKGSGKIVVECSGELVSVFSSSIKLEDFNASVIEYSADNLTYWTYMSGSTTVWGYGERIKLWQDKVISNKTYGSYKFETGGKAVSTSGTVKITSTGKLKVYGEELLLNGDFQIDSGGEFEFDAEPYVCD